MKETLKRRETWTLIVSAIAYLSGVAVALCPGIEGPIEALTAVLASSVSGIGIGSITQVKRAQQRGREVGQQVASVTGQVRNDIQTYTPPTVEPPRNVFPVAPVAKPAPQPAPQPVSPPVDVAPSAAPPASMAGTPQPVEDDGYGGLHAPEDEGGGVERQPAGGQR